MPVISVIMPTYKRRLQMVKRAINSVLNQTYLNLELIIIDDSPPDYEFRVEIEDYVNNLFNSKVILIKHKKNLGANAARNTGIRLAKGKYIAFLDDDDEWHIEKLEKQIKLFENSLVGLVYCSSKEIVTKNNIEISWKIKQAKYRGGIFSKLMTGNVIGSTSAVIIKKECFDTTGLFDENLNSAQDYELYLRIAYTYTIDFVDGDALLNYYIHEGDRLTGNYSVFQESRDYIERKHIEIIKEKPQLYSDFLFQRAKVSLIYSDFKKTFVYMIKGTCKYPINLLKFIFLIFKKVFKVKKHNI